MQEASGQLRHGSAACIERHSIFTLFFGTVIFSFRKLCQGVGSEFGNKTYYLQAIKGYAVSESAGMFLRNQTGAAMLVFDALLLLALPLLLTLHQFVEFPE